MENCDSWNGLSEQQVLDCGSYISEEVVSSWPEGWKDAIPEDAKEETRSNTLGDQEPEDIFSCPLCTFCGKGRDDQQHFCGMDREGNVAQEGKFACKKA